MGHIYGSEPERCLRARPMELLINPLSQRARELALHAGAAPNLFMREAAGHRTTTQNSLALLKRGPRFNQSRFLVRFGGGGQHSSLQIGLHL